MKQRYNILGSLSGLALLTLFAVMPALAQWTQIGSLNGPPLPVSAFANMSDDQGTNYLFAGTWGYGIYFSTNTGVNWVPDNGIFPTVFCDAFAVNGSKLFAGTNGNGVLLSSNYGASWSAVNTGLTNLAVAALLISGSNLFAGTDGGVFRSTNNGAGWSAVNTGLTNLHCKALAVNGSNLFAGTWGGGIFRSTNNGANWTAVNTGLTNLSLVSFVVNGSNLFAGTYGGGVCRSTNNGSNWSAVNTGLSNNYVRYLAIDGSTVIAGTTNGIFLTSNYGAGWSAINTGLTDTDVPAVAIYSGNFFAGTVSGGVCISKNYGSNWSAINNGLMASYIQNISSFVKNGSDLFAGTGGGGVFYSTDDGAGWLQVNDGLTDLDATALAAIGSNIFVGTYGGGVSCSNDNGASWFPMNTGLTDLRVNALAVSGSNLFAGTNSGIFYSGNSGINWTEVNNGLTDYGIFSFTVSGSSIYAGTGRGLCQSTNNGTSWTSVGSLPYNISAVAINGSIIVAGTNEGLFRTTDNGSNWTGDIYGLEGLPIRSFALNGSTFFAGTDYGMYFSNNNGTKWYPLNDGLGTTSISSLLVDGDHLLAGGEANSVWSRSTVPPDFIEQFAGVLPAVESGSVAWGDYDSDGKLDILLTGTTNGQLDGGITKIYHNTGAGFTEAYGDLLPQVSFGSVAWGDYDNDGKLDILLTGSDHINAPIAKIYHNTGSGFEEVFPGSLTGVSKSSVAWSDYDNDGKLDILLTGQNTNSTAISKIYHNTGSGFEEVYPGSLIGVMNSSVAWGDYDNDGKLDILLTGYDRYNDNAIAKIYHNTGSGFTEVYPGSLTGVSGSSVAWGDYDNDGKLDILLTGISVAKIYHNTGSGFQEVYSGQLTVVEEGSVAWGDYDNDGKLDILLSGVIWADHCISKIYHNTGSGFQEVSPGLLPGVYLGKVAWGDYDNDGKLDFLITGQDQTSNYSKIYHNIIFSANTAPTKPTGLTTIVSNDSALLSWNRSSDAETQGLGLTYNLRIGTTPSGITTESPMADTSTGWRRVVQFGNANEDTAWTIKNLPNGKYYWSVQAIDPAFAGSPFAAEASFPIGKFSLTIHVTNGTVEKNPAHAQYDYGTVVMLTPSAVSSYIFANWTGDVPAGHETDNPLFLTMDANKIITANFSVNPFCEQFAGLIPGLLYGSTAWCDYDNDGKLDILYTGVTGASPDITLWSRLYRNTGSGFTEAYPGQLPGIARGAVAWGDYDNDGKADIILAGINTVGGSSISKLYRNTGSGFTEVDAGYFTPTHYGSVAWGDFDNDGRLDILLTGATSTSGSFNPVSKIYRNTGSGFSEVYSGQLTGVYNSSAAWGDFDNDGRMDIVLTGADNSNTRIAKIYHNTGSGFTEVYPGRLIPVDLGSVSWGDYDNDGNLDILLTGDSNGGAIAKIYHNTGSGFDSISAGLIGVDGSNSAAWGDYNNDGLPDIMLTGYNGGNIAKLYLNTGSGFAAANLYDFSTLYNASIVWGDYNNDGRLDILLNGTTSTESGPVVKIYQNMTVDSNTVPTAPTGLAAIVSRDTVTLHWEPGTDAETPSGGLSYNIRLGTNQFGYDKLSPMANPIKGIRRVVRLGNADENTSWSISGLPVGTYYWSVQAIDHAFAGSAFAPAGTFTIQQSFSASPEALVFGIVTPGDSKEADVSITNIGDYDFTISNVAVGNEQFEITPTSGTIGPSASLIFHVTFTSYGTSPVLDTLLFTDNSVGTPHKVPLIANMPAIIATAGAHGSISPSGLIMFAPGSSQRYVPVPERGYYVDSLIVDGVSVPDSIAGYTFKNIITAHTIRAVFHLIPCVVHVNPKWNIVSLPASIAGAAKNVLFPTSIGMAFWYSGTGYVPKDTFVLGRSYWLKFSAGADIPMTGDPCDSISIPLMEGWNMIGGITDTVQVSSITAEPAGMNVSGFFGYESGYQTSGQIIPGKGYWVKVNQAGALHIAACGTVPGTAAVRKTASAELPPPPPGVNDQPTQKLLPTQYGLDQAYPNPFNPATDIGYRMADAGLVTIKVCDALGQEVATLVNQVKEPGVYHVQWNADGCASGMYIVRMTAVPSADAGRTFTGTRKVVFIK